MSAAAPGAVASGRRFRSGLSGFVRYQPLAAIALLLILLLAAAAILADHVAPYDPLEISLDAMLAPPSREHLFGTDSFGRDILSRIIYGARTALTIGVAASLLGCTIGSFLGIGSAYLGGTTDLVVQRLIDILLAFPIIVLALVIVAVLGHRVVFGIDLNLVVAIAIPIIPNVARVMRSAALTVIVLPFVDAARAAGYHPARVVLRHIAPNVMAPYLILLSAYIAQAILLEAALSFLGLGVTEPTPAWGLMLSGNASDFYRDAPWMIVFPGLAVTVAVLGFSLLGDGLRDWLDPKSKL